MLIWVVIIFILAVFSLLGRMGSIPLTASGEVNFGVDLALFLVSLGLLARMYFFQRKGERENLLQKIKDLEEELKKYK